MARDTKLRRKSTDNNELAAELETTSPARIKTDNVQSVEMQRRSLLQHYKQEKKVSVNISPMYQKYFGKVMSVAIQGITVAIPCDGKTYKINKTHAIEARSRVAKIDNFITRRERMKDISNNFESTPGEIKFY